MILMRRHGATLAGTTLRELVFRTIYSHANAEIQLRSMLLGKIGPLSRGEAERTGPHQLQPRPMARAWEYWTTRLEKSGEMPKSAPRRARKTQAAKPGTAKSPRGQMARRGAKASRARR
jgi:HCOMODA/2-hydroxy-3-carboxy-muconic semialdehyde decarboxylase